MTRKLFVANLPYATTDQEVAAIFAKAGTVVSAKVIREKETQKSRGFAFVEMATAEEAAAAIERYHGQPFGGRNLVVNEAKDKPRDDGPRYRRDDRRGGRDRDARW